MPPAATKSVCLPCSATPVSSTTTIRSAFWIVGDQTALANLPNRGAASAQQGFTMPNLKSVILTAELDPDSSQLARRFTNLQVTARILTGEEP